MQPMDITYTLSRKHSAEYWSDYHDFHFNEYEYFTLYLKDRIKGVRTYDWINSYDNIVLSFEDESYKTWFLLNLEHEQQTA